MVKQNCSSNSRCFEHSFTAKVEQRAAKTFDYRNSLESADRTFVTTNFVNLIASVEPVAKLALETDFVGPFVKIT